MRQKQINKINKKKLRYKYSSIEIEEFAEEIKEYQTLLKSIGFQIYKKNDVKKKILSPKIKSKKNSKEKHLIILEEPNNFKTE